MDNVWLDVKAITLDGGEFFGPFKITFHEWTRLHRSYSFENLVRINSCRMIVRSKLCVRRNIRNVHRQVFISCQLHNLYPRRFIHRCRFKRRENVCFVHGINSRFSILDSRFEIRSSRLSSELIYVINVSNRFLEHFIKPAHRTSNVIALQIPNSESRIKNRESKIENQDSIFLAKLSRIACHPACCISMGFSVSASKMVVMITSSPCCENVVTTVRLSDMVYLNIFPISTSS